MAAIGRIDDRWEIKSENVNLFLYVRMACWVDGFKIFIGLKQNKGEILGQPQNFQLFSNFSPNLAWKGRVQKRKKGK